MAPRLPLYLDGLIASYQSGRTARWVHLGFWEQPPSAADLAQAGAFAQAQLRLNDALLAMAALADGQRVVDVGCGLGGTLAAINGRHRNMQLLGINIDARQLALCRDIEAGPGNTVRWLQADACALPLPRASADRLLCIEAMFHFDSRERFLQEAARILAPGGRLVCSDIVWRGPALISPDEHALADAVRTGFGPWPALLHTGIDHRALAAAAGLHCVGWFDATEATLPSHVFTAPAGAAARGPIARAAAALAQLHRGARLAYPLMAFERSG